MRADPKDLAAGGIFVTIGLAFCIATLLNLNIGSAARMGPGYFPVVLGGLLALLGLAITVRGLGRPSSWEGGFAWRGFVLIGIAPILFGVLVAPLGLVPALFLSTLVAALSSREVGPVKAMLVAAGLTVFCLLVFSYGLRLPIPLFGPLLSGPGS